MPKKKVFLPVTEEGFRNALRTKLGIYWERALKLFQDCGPNLAFDLTNVLDQACDQGEGKIVEVLNQLEEHYKEHLGYQHPEIRGMVRDCYRVNKTEQVLLDICRKTLQLQPNPTETK